MPGLLSRCARHSLAAIPFASWITLTIPAQTAQPASPSNFAGLQAGFRQPPASARLRCYWWWLNGHTDKATVTHDLEAMKAKGFGGALLVDANGADQNGNANVAPGPTFASPAWVELYTHALREADRLGLEITLNITSGWNLGGPEVTPAQASKLLTWTRTPVAGGQHLSMQLPAPAQSNGFYRQIAVLAYPLQHGTALAAQPSGSTLRARSAAAETGFSMPSSSAMLLSGVHSQFAQDPGFADTPAAAVQDISANFDPDGTLHWDAPPGQWEVLRIGYTDSGARVSTASGAWQGLAIDYLSRAAFDSYWNQTVEPLLAAAKPYRSLKYLATDSWELGGANWTADFRQQFQQLRGYDPVPWLPVVAGRIVADREQSTRFLTDLRRTVADLIVSQHYDIFAANAQQHGLGMQAESGGPHGAPIDALETFRHAAIPQTEFWAQNAHRSTDEERFFTKEASSAAHIYGQPLVAQEGETSIGPQWSESLATDLKPTFDMAITEGMNRMVWHEFTSSPASTGLPGQEYFAGTHLNPKVTWWNAGEAFFRYMNRIQFLMQQGRQVDDLLYFYGDNVPNFVRLKADDPAHVLPGYDYDVTGEDALLHGIRIDHGQLTGRNGMSWRALALPTTGRLSLPVLRRIEAFVREGGAVIGTQPTSPDGVTAPETMAQFHKLATAIWGPACAADAPHSYGQGQIFCTQNAHAAMQQMHVQPDAMTEDAGPGEPYATSTAGFDYVHRRIGRTDIYFVRNGSSADSVINVLFRANGRTPQLWDAVTGATAEVPQHQSLAGGQVRVSLHLAPFGSVFVVFADQYAGKPPSAIVTPQLRDVVPLHPWEISFQPGRGAPQKPRPIPGLTSWTDWPEPGIRYFSGTATYRAQVVAPAHTRHASVWLQFSGVREIAQVKVNGKEAGTIWAKPYRVRVDSLLHPGVNTLSVQVTNLWPNRIIGDLQPGATQHFTATNIKAYRADSPLLPSGLIGPVQWAIDDPAKH